MMLNYFGKPAYYLGFFTIAWGLISGLTSLVQNFAGIVVCRLFLGFVGRLRTPTYLSNSLLTVL